MYIKNQLKKRFIISVVTVIALVITIISSSYALFMDIKTDVNAQILSVGDLQVTFTGGSNININGIEPMSDSVAYSKTNNIYTFTIQNTGTVPYAYDISLENNPDYQSSPLLNHAFIRLDFNYTGARTLSQIADSKIFQGNLPAGQAKQFDLRLWVGDADTYNLPNEALGSEIHLNIIVDGKAGTL
ncbi:MAG: hypothetical protein PHF21_01720 [Bacilli bacterium]|nr:hypothetical protein [Bacilli bacterium]